jgi:hypothetical protein
MPFLDANFAALQRLQPGFAVPPSGDRVRLHGGSWRLFNDERGTAIHSRDPEREADRAVADLLRDGQSDVIVAVGLGVGFLLDALERRGWTGKVLALEPAAETIAPLLERRDWQSWIASDRLRLLAAPVFEGAAEAWRWFGDGSTEPPVFINPSLARLRPDAVAGARDVLRRIRFNAEANARAKRRHGGRYLLNTLGNLRALAHEADVASLFGAAPGRPAIVVAAGPSLDRTMPALRDVGERALIITVDTALRPLLDAGIEPHLVVAVDPGESNARHLYDLPPCSRTFLAAEASMDPAAVRAFRGRTFLFCVSNHEPWPWLQAHGAGRGALRAWGSVLTSAFDLAVQAGCDPIVFTGADLAYSDDRPYARGVTYEQDWRRLADWGVPYEQQCRDQLDRPDMVERPDINGRPVRTAPHLMAFRDWLVEQTADASRTFINATEGGTLFGGRLRQGHLAQVIRDCPSVDPSPRTLVARRYVAANNSQLLAAARGITGDAPLLARWEAFADGITAARIRDAVAGGVCEPAGETPSIGDATDRRATLDLDLEPAYWAATLVDNTPLVPMTIPPDEMLARGESRLYRFRTTTARFVMALLRLPDGALAEDGRPLRQAASLETLAAGEYLLWRDELVIASSDGTDPRYSGRTYTILLPQGVAYLERRPLPEILANRF